MLKKLNCIILAFAMLLTLASCKKVPIVIKEQKIGVDQLLSNMSLEEKVGQLFLFGINGEQLDDETISFLQNTQAGNIILFSKNIKDANQLRNLCASIQSEIGKNADIPAFIGIDQEGGQVTRILDGATFFPGAMALSAAGDPQSAYMQGQYVGEELKALGINLNFAPVADINSNPKNPVINVRSYGDTPETVSAYSAAMVKGLQQNILSCVKHFPGHGDTTVDSHVNLPVSNKTIEELRQLELIPFQNAIENGADAVMTAHIAYSKIDSNQLPASLSGSITTDLLRNKLNFKGLIITDSLKMNAIKNNYDIGHAAIKAINAGANLLITGSGESDPEDLYQQSRAYASVLAAVKNGTIKHETLYNSVKLILEYKEKYGILKNPLPSEGSIDWEAHKSLADEISLNSITLAEGAFAFPIPAKTLVISDVCSYPLSLAEESIPEGKNSFAYLLAKKISSDYMTLSKAPSEASIQSMLKKAREYDAVVLAVSHSGQLDAANRIIRANPKTIVISMGSPYLLNQLKNAKAYLCSYEYTPPAVKSLLKILTGEAEVKGILPIKR